MTYLNVFKLPLRSLFDSGAYYIFQGTSAALIWAAVLIRLFTVIASELMTIHEL